MLYLTGVTNDRDEPALIDCGIGLMVQPGNSYHLRATRYPFYGADNGCFANRWTDDRWIHWLGKLDPQGCLFAVSPDVYPDAVESLRRGLVYAPFLREMGFPVAVVAQDHAERLSWPWDDLDVLFVGGARKPDSRDEWKLSPDAEALVREARNRGKWVHMGRVNSLARMERARSMGCNSADGTFMKYRRRRCASEMRDMRDGRGAIELGDWQAWLASNPTLPGFTTFESPSLPVHRLALERAS